MCVLEDLPEAAALDVLHRDEVRGADAAERERLRDVRVLQQCREPRLAHEPTHGALVEGKVWQKALQRDHALEALDPALDRAMNRRHAADADPFVDRVRPEDLARRRFHPHHSIEHRLDKLT